MLIYLEIIKRGKIEIMKNEQGYIYNKPFKRCNSDEQVSAMINIYDQSIVFDFKKEQKTFKKLEWNNFDEVYAVDSHFNTITTLKLEKGNFHSRNISSVTLKYNSYFIQNKKNNEIDEIKHFTKQTDIKEIQYYNESIRDVFVKKPMIDIRLGKNTIEVKKVKTTRKKIGKINLSGKNEVEIFLKKEYKATCEIIKEKYNIEAHAYFIISFKNRDSI